MLNNKKGQSEMMGFIVIVVLVIVAIMIFLIISIRNKESNIESKDIENLLTSVMHYTTECAIVSEPRYSSVEDLIKSCFDNEKCSNLDKMACDYLYEIIENIMEDVIKSEGAVSGWRLSIISRVNEEEEPFFSISGGNMTGVVFGGQRIVSSGGVELIARLNLGYD